MKENQTDKLLKQKMESIDPLSGGIVFGKEEAWEKLQARLDKKPLRVTLGLYRYVAAAVLLLLVCAALYYSKNLSPIKFVNAPQKTVSTPHNGQQTSSASIMPSEPGYVRFSSGNSKLEHKEKIKKVTVTPAASLPDAPMSQPVITEQTTKNDSIPITEISLSERIKKMKVVHLNELENGTDETAPAPEWVSAPFIKSNLPVIHVNQLTHEQFRLKLTDNTRLTLRHIFSPKPERYLLMGTTYQNLPFSN